MDIKRDDLTGAALSGNKVETALINWGVAQCGVDILLPSTNHGLFGSYYSKLL